MTEPIIRHIHDGSLRATLILAGGGSRAVPWLLATPGASRTILEVRIPYAAEALEDVLACSTEQAVSERTGRALAGTAFHRAAQLAGRHVGIVGVGCTAALATDRVRKGSERAWICVRTLEEMRVVAVSFQPGRANRDAQEEALARVVINELAECAGAADRLQVDWKQVGAFSRMVTPAGDDVQALLSGQIDCVMVSRDGRQVAGGDVPNAFLAGSFDPIHLGHSRLVQAAGDRLGREVCLELSVVNADKPGLSYDQTQQRLARIQGRHAVVLTRAATFVEKATRFPGRWFVVGYDTVIRVLDDDYYGGRDGLLAALRHIRERGCRFLVGGRLTDAAFHVGDALAIPDEFQELFDFLPEEEFRVDVSSTEIRGARR
jgi:hypothetical protein